MKEFPVALPIRYLAVVACYIAIDGDCTGDDCHSLEVVGVTLFQSESDWLQNWSA